MCLTPLLTELVGLGSEDSGFVCLPLRFLLLWPIFESAWKVPCYRVFVSSDLHRGRRCGLTLSISGDIDIWP